MIRIERLNFTVADAAYKADTFALRNVSLHVRPGEYFVLLGPTGSGKTLLLECLCGLNHIDSGRVSIDGVDVTKLEPRSRRWGYVPQDYALFPHMTVRGNIGFSLAGAVAARVAEVMELVGVAHLADRFPQKLSGGEKQRVALARALAVGPRVLLLDEPVSALDEQTRDELCRQLKRLQQDTQTTTVHVCHNFTEMLSVADRVAVIDQGQILQVGTPREVLERPASTRIARFAQVGNLLSARAVADGTRLRLVCPGGIELRARIPESGEFEADVVAMIRPENIALTANVPENVPPEATILQGTVAELIELGPVVKVRVACGALEWLVSLGKREYTERNIRVGDRVHLVVAAENVHVMRSSPP